MKEKLLFTIIYTYTFRQHDYAAENEQLKKQIEQLVKRVQTLEKVSTDK